MLSEDKKHKETVEARNQLDSLIYSTEKSLKEYGGDLDAGSKGKYRVRVKKAKAALEGQDAQAMRTAADQLSQSSHKLAESMYAKASQQQKTGRSTGEPKEQRAERWQEKERGCRRRGLHRG